MTRHNLANFVKHRTRFMVILACVMAFMFWAADLSARNVNDIKANQEANADRIVALQNEVIKLQQTANEMALDNKCLLQLHVGGNFTSRAECQARLEKNSGITVVQPVSQQPSVSPAQPSQPQEVLPQTNLVTDLLNMLGL